MIVRLENCSDKSSCSSCPGFNLRRYYSSGINQRSSANNEPLLCFLPQQKLARRDYCYKRKWVCTDLECSTISSGSGNVTQAAVCHQAAPLTTRSAVPPARTTQWTLASSLWIDVIGPNTSEALHNHVLSSSCSVLCVCVCRPTNIQTGLSA